MSTLPVPGTDSGTWGGVLNTWLEVSHSVNGMPLRIVLSGQTFPATGFTIADPASANNVTQGIASGNCPFTLPAAGVGKEFWVLHQQPGGTAYTPTFPSSVYWMGNTAPVFSGPGFIDVIHGVCYDGSNWFVDLTPGFSAVTAISTVGSPVQASSSSLSLPITGLSPTAGNLVVLGIFSWGVTAPAVSSVADSNSATWTSVGSEATSTGAGKTWFYKGVVNTSGATTITVTCTGSSPLLYGTCQEFGHNTGTTWAVDGSPAVVNGTGGTTAAFGTLTPGGASEMWIGVIGIDGSTSAPAGYTKESPGGAVSLTFNVNVTGAQTVTVPITPNASFSNYWAGVASLIKIT